MKNKIGYNSNDILKYSVEQKFLGKVSLFASILTGLSLVTGLYLKDLFFIIACTLSTLIYLFAYLIIRMKSKTRISAWLMVLNTLVLFNIMWLRFEGSKGASPPLILVLLVCISLFLRKSERLVAFSILLIDLTALLYIEYNASQMIKSYESNLHRMTDTMITLAICGIFIVFVVQGILQSYFREKTKADQVDQLKSAFLANISHEIRTPMNAILGFSNLIIQPNTKRKDRQIYSKFVFDACKNLINLVDKIINTAKIESNQINIHKVKCNITDIMEYVYCYFKDSPDLQKKNNIDFRLNPASLENDIIIETDPAQLKQVLISLLDNAIKFTPAGLIEFGYGNRESDLLFYVKDAGIGIPKEEYNNIFNRFSKIHDSKDRFYGGVGLGLTLSKKILELLNGKIWVTSEINKGSTFYFTIPYNKIEIGQRQSLVTTA